MEQLALGRLQTLEQLEEALGHLRERRGTALCLDLSDTPKLSTSAIQLLVSAQKSWAADGVALALRNLSADARGTLELLGLAGEFEQAAEALA